MRWYAVHVHSGFEKRVKESIEERIAQNNLEALIDEIVIPTEDVVEVRRGKRVTSERKFFPGYILVKMKFTDASWQLIKSTPKVTGFLGSSNRPSPISDEEAERILSQMREGVDRPRQSVSFTVGEQVRVCDGPFASFNGVVEEVDEERARIKVTVSIFGRETPVDLDYNQVEKT